MSETYEAHGLVFEVRFDKEQKRTGFNKYGHYQFGKLTCQFCKSDNTYKLTEWDMTEDQRKYITDNPRKSIYACPDCNGREII